VNFYYLMYKLGYTPRVIQPRRSVGAEQRVCVCILLYVCLDTLLGLDVRRGFTSVAVCHREPCSVCLHTSYSVGIVFCLRSWL
jgi:hypothetical protein